MYRIHPMLGTLVNVCIIDFSKVSEHAGKVGGCSVDLMVSFQVYRAFTYT